LRHSDIQSNWILADLTFTAENPRQQTIPDKLHQWWKPAMSS